MLSRLLRLCFLTSMIFSTVVYAANDDLEFLRQSAQKSNEWRLIKYDKIRNIKAYDKRETGQNLRSFKVEYEVEGNLDDIARVYFDFDNYNRWFYELISAKLLTKISPTEFYYYTSHRAPPTLPDRDTVLHATIEKYNKKTGYARLTLIAEPNYIPAKPPLIRMPKMNMTVTWTPTENGTINGVAEGFVDPGGITPAWAINYVQRQAPYLTAVGLLRSVKQQQQAGTNAQPLFSLKE